MTMLKPFAMLLAAAFALAAQAALAQVPTGPVAIQTVRGNYLTAIDGGGVAGRPAINTDATAVSGWETFTLVQQPDGLYAIQTVNGTYLTALNGGGVGGRVAVHTDARAVNAWEKFGVLDMGDGTWAFLTANLHFLTALDGGGIGGGRNAIHTDASRIDAWEKFRLVSLAAPTPAGLTGRWNGPAGIYEIVQAGNTFTWRVGGELGQGTISGASVSATWGAAPSATNGGSATGTIRLQDGLPVQIDWSNGVSFRRAGF